MRAVGVALDEATLQETAYALGIDRTVSSMTRAQKTQLLYYQIMTKTATMQRGYGTHNIATSKRIESFKRPIYTTSKSNR